MQYSTWINISNFFIRRYRVGIMLFLAVVVFGVFAYATLLKRDGFPAVKIPIVLIQTPYFVDDAEKVDVDVTKPISDAMASLDDIQQITSSSSGNFSLVTVQFVEGTTVDEGLELVKEKIATDITLPELARPEPFTINAAAIDGKHEMVFVLASRSKSVVEMQNKGREVVELLEDSNVIKEANVIEQVAKQKNPVTGEEFDYQSSFGRVGYRDDGELVFLDSVSIGVIKEKQYDTIRLSESVREIIDDMKDNDELTDDFEVVYIADQAEDIQNQIASLESNAWSGLIAVMVIMLVFVNWRSSIIMALFVPFVMFCTLITFYFLGYTLNVISLFALILVLGLLVDDGIVVVEGIEREKRNGLKGMHAISTAIENVALGDIAGTLTTMIVFVPMLFISGVLGEFIILIPITVIITLFYSLVTALTLLPMPAYFLFPDKKDEESDGGVLSMIGNIFYYATNGVSILIDLLAQAMGSFTRFYLTYPIFALLIILPLSCGLIFWGGSYASKLTFSVFPAPKDSEEIMVNISMSGNQDLGAIQDVGASVERAVDRSIGDEVVRVSYLQATRESVMMFVKLTKIGTRDQKSPELEEILADEVADIDTDAKIKVSQQGVGPQADEYQFSMQIFGTDAEKLKNAANEIKDFLSDRELDGGEVTEAIVPPTDSIARVDGRRYIEVKAKTSDAQNTGLILQIQEQVEEEFDGDRLEELGLEDDALGFDFGQESENLESFESTGVALVFALVIMYAVLIIQFNSFSQPFLIFLAIPLSFPGLFPGLYFTDNSLGFLVSLGIISLTGIVVNNTIMIVEYVNQAMHDGMDPKEAVAKAVELRLRPIVTTSASTLAGLLPLALSDPFWEGLAFAIIFGLVSSASLSILVFPVFCWLFEFLRYIRKLFFFAIKHSPNAEVRSDRLSKLGRYAVKSLVGV